jgi:hypothetical protein
MLQQPDRFTGAVTNAIVNISAAVGEGIRLWVDIMLKIGQRTTLLNEFLEAGKVAAWRCGLTHYRSGALQTCEKLHLDLIKIALGIPVDLSLSQDVLISRLNEDPWLQPQYAGQSPGKTRLLLRRSGAFSGFGGGFITPPQVKPGGRGFAVRAADRYFLFFADIFGSVLLPLCREEYDQEVAAAGSEEANPSFKLSPLGTLEYGRFSFSLPRLSGFSSFSSDGHTFSAALPLSHSLFFGGLTCEE